MHLKKFTDMLDWIYIYVDYEDGIELGTHEYTKYKEGENTVIRLHNDIEFVFDSGGTFTEHRVERH